MLFNDANYSKYDPHVVTCGVAQTVFPAVTSTILVKPRKIVVQSSVTNSGFIYIGKTGVKSDLSTGAYELVPGQMIVLPGHMLAEWFHISDTAAQTLFITYLSGEY